MRRQADARKQEEENRKKAINDSKLREQLGQRASKWVRKNRTWNQIAQVTVGVYSKLRG